MKVGIPAEFWRSMTFEDFSGIVDRGGLNAAQCAKLWEMTGRADACPKSMALLLNREDVMREFPPVSSKDGA